MRLKTYLQPQHWKNRTERKEKPKWATKKCRSAQQSCHSRRVQLSLFRLLRNSPAETRRPWTDKSKWNYSGSQWINKPMEKRKSKLDKGYLGRILDSVDSRKIVSQQESRGKGKKLTLRLWRWSCRWFSKKTCSYVQLTRTLGSVKKFPSYRTYLNLTTSFLEDRSSTLNLSKWLIKGLHKKKFKR